MTTRYALARLLLCALFATAACGASDPAGRGSPGGTGGGAGDAGTGGTGGGGGTGGTGGAGGTGGSGGAGGTGGSAGAGGMGGAGGSAGAGGMGGSAGAGGGGGDPSRPLGSFQDGIATYYDADGSGSCSFDAATDIHVAALNAPQYEGAAWCGACAEVEGPLGTVHVRIVDLCPECASGHLDLHPEAFDLVADRVDGRVDIRWRFVTCPVEEPIAYRFQEGSNPWWTAIQVLDHRLPIASLEHWNGSAWVELPRQSYNYFVAHAGLGDPPYRLRVTATDGQTLEDSLPSLQVGTLYRGDAQFE